jgi:hypothetical protein
LLPAVRAAPPLNAEVQPRRQAVEGQEVGGGLGADAKPTCTTAVAASVRRRDRCSKSSVRTKTLGKDVCSRIPQAR